MFLLKKNNKVNFLEPLKLARDLARRDLRAQYSRSSIGQGWLFLTPLCLLAMYATIFGYFFNVKWSQVTPGGISEDVGFVLPFFVGLSLYLFFSDAINSSSNLFINKRTFVLKSACPIWVLWLSNMIRASTYAGASLILVIFLALIQGKLTMNGIFYIFVLIPIILIFISSMSLIFCSLGPFIGDISEVMKLVLRILFYASPIAYPLTMVPEPYRTLMWLNPLSSVVEIFRPPIIYGTMPSSDILIIFFGLTIILLIFAVWLFNRVKHVIPDVV